MIKIKLGVVIAGLNPEEDILEPAYVMDEIHRELGLGDVWITGGIDGNHKYNPTNGHYVARGIDLRKSSSKLGEVVNLMTDRLKNWKVILEDTHIHCQKR